MNDDTMTTDGSAARRPRDWARTATLLGGGVLAGAMLAGVASANAATSTPSPSTSTGTGSSSSSTSTTTPPKDVKPGGSTPVRSDEKSVSSTISATLTEKALAQVSGGTVIRVETDAGDAAYEVHMKKADGSLVTVKFDKSLAFVAVEDGMGKGDPAPSGKHGTPPSGAPQGAPSSSTTTG
jgi:bacteriocin-like protein